MNQYPDQLAAFYEASHEHGSVGDESFYRDVAADVTGPVLEAACGTGRLYLDLWRAGVDVDGFDASRPMLELLREKAAAEGVRPTVWQADFRSIGAARSYALAMVPYNSLCNLETVNDQLEALAALHGVLEPGGRLVFDVYVPRYEIIAESFGEWHTEHEFTYDGRQLTGRTRATIADRAKQTYRTEHEIRDVTGDRVAHETFVLSHLPPQQVELLARQSPFDRWTVSGGFDGDALTDGDTVQVWEFQKAG